MLLQIPGNMVKNLIHEREMIQRDASIEISHKWGDKQTLTGPYIALPYDKYPRKYASREMERDEKDMGWIYLLPHELKINGEVQTEKRSRSLHEVIVYDSGLNFSGNFDLDELLSFGVKKDQIYFEKAIINFGISDLKGLGNQLDLTWNDKKIEMNSGTNTQEIIRNGVQANIDLIPESQGSYNFKIDINIKGSKSLQFVPTGKTTTVQLKSNWDSPSFNGAYLPNKRVVDKKGFSAEWTILHLNRNFPQVFTGPDYRHHISGSAFGTNLIIPVNGYKKSYRVAQYGLLFLVLTFLAFFLVEILQKVFIHPIQYLLVGTALVMFFSLLLSLSEHIHFNLAYLIAAILTLGLITWYTASILKSKQVGWMIFGILSLLYTFIFSIIQMEDHSLLIGCLGIFSILALVMYFSRKIDWYNTNLGEFKKEKIDNKPEEVLNL